MVIGVAEATSIAAPLQGVLPRRPLTHDLFLTLFGKMKVTLKRVVITDLRDDVYYALLYLDVAGSEMTLDSRPSDAIGLAQVQLNTARFYKRGVVLDDLYDPATNLMIGFRYLRDLLGTYHDLRLALLAYNRGPTKVNQLLGDGREPGNGYATKMLQGYPRTGGSP